MNFSVRKSAQLLLLAAWSLQGVHAAATDALPQRPEAFAGTTDRLIIKYRSGDAALPTATADAALRTASNRQGVQSIPLRRMANGAHVFQFNRRLSAAEAATLAQSMKAGDANVEYAEPDLLLQSTQSTVAPMDPMYSQQWALSHSTSGIRAPGAWSTSRGSGVVVAVIDTGVRPHADLVANLVAGVDFITDARMANDGTGRDGDPSDPGDNVAAGFCGSGSPARNSSWHGTHVAGIIAAASNSTGISGVAPLAKVQALRALGRCGGYTSDIADAITWASGGMVSGVQANATPAKVINLSLGGAGTCSATLQTAVQSARARGAVVVVSAGNSNANAGQSTPANCPGVITVAATGMTGGKASYSNYGSVVSLAAPGGDSGGSILSTLNTGTSSPGADNYVSYMGTSMAAPMVSGVAALMLAAKPSLTPDQVAQLLVSTATPFPAACNGCGSGIVNAAAAVAAAVGAAAPPSVPAPSNPPAPTPPSASGAVAEIEPNNTHAQAQMLAYGAVTVAGKLSLKDLDHYRVTIPAGKRVTMLASPVPGTAAGVGVFSSAGRQLLLVAGASGAARQVVVNNSGATPVDVILRVYHSGGVAGSYSLKLTP